MFVSLVSSASPTGRREPFARVVFQGPTRSVLPPHPADCLSANKGISLFRITQIFVPPAPGNRYCESGKLTEVGCSGYGWALTIHSDNAHSLNFNEGGFNPNGYYRRAYGLQLRCLQE